MGRASRWLALMMALAFILAVATAHGGSPQQRPQAQLLEQEPTPSTAIAEDVRSIDTILAALYDTISGPAGQHRDWNRLRALFVPGARMVAVGHNGNGVVQTHNFSVEEYVAHATPILEKEGFYEREISRHADAYENIAQVFSTYESRHNGNEKPFQRGINSIQLMNDGHRWWIVTIFWQAETPGHPIPKKFLR